MPKHSLPCQHRLVAIACTLLLVCAGAHAQTSDSAAASARRPVVVSGVVPDEATRQTILNRVRELYGRDAVVDQLGVANTSAPPNWAEYVKKMISADLKGIHRGHIAITGNTVELVGETDSTATRDKIAANMTAHLNPTYTVHNRLLTGSAPQARIDNILIDKIVKFESGSAVLSPVGRRVLDELIPVLRTLNGKKIQVIGHTDNVGARPANQLLSQNRAAAVKTYLVANNLPADTFLTLGLGPDQPLVGNDTAEGRAKNRRIEFKVMP